LLLAADPAVQPPSLPPFASFPEPVEPGGGAQPEWHATVGAGLIYVDGNAFGLTGNLAAAGERKSEDWVLAGRLSGAYGVTRASGEEERKTSAYAAALQLRVDRRLTPRVSIYLLSGVETDHVQSLEWRPWGELGAGYIWIDSKEGEERTFLRTDLGFRVSQDFRFQYYPTRAQLPDPELLLAPKLGLLFQRHLASDLLISQEVAFLPGVRGPFRYLFSSATKVSVGLVAALRFGLSLTVTLDGRPAPGKRPFDSGLAVTLDYVL
jgi:hypothetical protein